MNAYLAAFLAGLMAGAPPRLRLFALVGLLGMVLGEAAVPSHP